MNMATNPTDMIFNATRDGADLVAWAEPNSAAWSDERIEAAGWKARGRTVPEELAFGVPVLLYAAEDVEPTSLMAALVADSRPRIRACDRCGRVMAAQDDPDHHLWISCGATTAVIACCSGCRAHLDYSLAVNGEPVLAWR